MSKYFELRICNDLQLQGFTDHIEDISEYFGYISFGKINSGNIFYLIRRVNHDGIMMEDHYLLYGLFLSWGKLYIGPKKNTKKLMIFCVFFPRWLQQALFPKFPPKSGQCGTTLGQYGHSGICAVPRK